MLYTFHGILFTGFRHVGHQNGIWTSGRKHENGDFEFVPVHAKRNLNQFSGHFVPGPDPGACLQYFVDARNSYSFSDLPCRRFRSFICEEKGTDTILLPDNAGLQEFGNQYFISTWLVNCNQCVHCFINSIFFACISIMHNNMLKSIKYITRIEKLFLFYTAGRLGKGFQALHNK